MRKLLLVSGLLAGSWAAAVLPPAAAQNACTFGQPGCVNDTHGATTSPMAGALTSPAGTLGSGATLGRPATTGAGTAAGTAAGGLPIGVAGTVGTGATAPTGAMAAPAAAGRGTGGGVQAACTFGQPGCVSDRHSAATSPMTGTGAGTFTSPGGTVGNAPALGAPAAMGGTTEAPGSGTAGTTTGQTLGNTAANLPAADGTGITTAIPPNGAVGIAGAGTAAGPIGGTTVSGAGRSAR